jgi:hypothetical protein
MYIVYKHRILLLEVDSISKQMPRWFVDVKKHHRCVPKDNEFRCLANGRSIKVGVALSGTIASHKTLPLVVGMTMILDDLINYNIRKMSMDK